MLEFDRVTIGDTELELYFNTPRGKSSGDSDGYLKAVKTDDAASTVMVEAVKGGGSTAMAEAVQISSSAMLPAEIKASASGQLPVMNRK